MSYFAVIAVRKAAVAVAFMCSLAVGSLQADLTVTQMANYGVLLDDGENRIFIDALVVEPYSVFRGLDGQARTHFDDVTGPFADIDLVLASHRHHDHNQPSYACQFMRNSPQTRMVSSPQVLGLMREKCRSLVTGSERISEMLPTYEQQVVLESGTARVDVFLLSHGTRKYAKIQNFGHLVTMGGLRVLHIGDAAMTPDDFVTAGITGEGLDIALIPVKYFQPGPGPDMIAAHLNAPIKIATHIAADEAAEVSEYMAREYPGVLVMHEPLDQKTFSSGQLGLPWPE